MNGACIMCGCTHSQACVHPDEGPCFWIDNPHGIPVCSSCADHSLVRSSEHTIDPRTYATAMTPYILRQFFKGLGMKVTVGLPSKKHHSYGKGWHVECLQGNPDTMKKLLEQHFTSYKSTGAGTCFIDPTSMYNRQEATL